MPALRIANIVRDREILEIARSEALEFTSTKAEPEELRRAAAFIRDHWQRRYGLIQVA
jgi:ATP-dependent DNA helicase RecG